MKLVFCIINAQIDQTKRKIEICSVSHNRNAKWEMRNPKPKPESSKPENQNSSKPETNPSTKSKSKSKSKTKTMREANENANQNSKRNHIMTIAKRSDNAKCEIKFAFAPCPRPRPRPHCPLLPVLATLNISTNNDRIGAPQMRCSCNKILHTCNGNLPLISLCTYFAASRRPHRASARTAGRIRVEKPSCAELDRTRPHRV